jgi:hypothetical protein
LCGEPADGQRAFVSFRRADGSKGMVDQQTLAFLRSPNGPAIQNDLDALFATATRVQYLETVWQDRTGSFQPRLVFSDAGTLADLRNAMAIREGFDGHLMSIGECRMDFFAGDECVAKIEILGALLRWSKRWKSDAPLLDPGALASMLKANGRPNLSEMFEREKPGELERQTAHEKWIATWQPAIPPGLEPFIEALSQETYSPEPGNRPTALEILAAQFPLIDEQIRKLFACFGHCNGPWSGCPMVEMAPAFLLQSFTTDQLLHALRSQDLSHQHLQGAARFLCRWARKEEAESKKAFAKATGGTTFVNNLPIT